MPKRQTQFLPGHYYHIYNRGANRDAIFFCEENYAYLLKLMKKYLLGNEIAVIAYCLMPNHYHFLLRLDGEVDLSEVLARLFRAYVLAVNKQQGRTGTLFEGRFQDVHIDREGYLQHLCRYIHANPVKAGLVTDLDEWPYSNYLEWVGKRPGKLVDMAFVAELCGELPRLRDESSRNLRGSGNLGLAYRAFVLDYLRGVAGLPEDIQVYLFG